MRKKLQVFISSTYKDLVAERQAAVEAVLAAGHIPAGMELFKAGDETQLATIKKWIDESDTVLLILGGRYGSIEPIAQKSYTHLEYEHALSKNKRPFAVVISEEALLKRVQTIGSCVHETENADKYTTFRQVVTDRICKFFADGKDIKLAIHETLKAYEQDSSFTGWISGKEFVEKKAFRPLLEGEFLHSLFWEGPKASPVEIYTDVDGDGQQERIRLYKPRQVGITLAVVIGKEVFSLGPITGLDKSGFLKKDSYCQLAIKDVNNDGMPEILLAIGDGVMEMSLQVWRFDADVFYSAPRGQHINPFRCIGILEGGFKVSVLNGGRFRVHAGSQGFFMSYIWDGSQFVKKSKSVK